MAGTRAGPASIVQGSQSNLELSESQYRIARVRTPHASRAWSHLPAADATLEAFSSADQF
jgi:hypothetical protein